MKMIAGEFSKRRSPAIYSVRTKPRGVSEQPEFRSIRSVCEGVHASRQPDTTNDTPYRRFPYRGTRSKAEFATSDP